MDPELKGNESQRKHTVISSFKNAANKKTDINPNKVQIMKTCWEYMGLKKFFFSDFSKYFR